MSSALVIEIRDVPDLMRVDNAAPPQALQADCGPTRNEFLLQFTADTTCVELKVVELSAWRTALCGLLGLGLYSSLEKLPAHPRKAITFQPRMAAVKQTV